MNTAVTPAGYFIIMRQEIGAPYWRVRVLDFATWKHREFKFTTEAQARTEFIKWII